MRWFSLNTYQRGGSEMTLSGAMYLFDNSLSISVNKELFNKQCNNTYHKVFDTLFADEESAMCFANKLSRKNGFEIISCNNWSLQYFMKRPNKIFVVESNSEYKVGRSIPIVKLQRKNQPTDAFYEAAEDFCDCKCLICGEPPSNRFTVLSEFGVVYVWDIGDKYRAEYLCKECAGRARVKYNNDELLIKITQRKNNVSKS